MVQTDSVVIQINNRVGENYTWISIPYSKIEKVSAIDAWIESVDGKKIRELKKSDIADKSAISDISMYEDDFIKYFQLKHNEYPYRIVYTYQTTSKEFFTLAYWSPVLHSKIPTRAAALKVVLPKGFQYVMEEKNIQSCRKDSSGSNLTLDWKSSYEKILNEEVFAQAFNIVPIVRVSPLNFDYGAAGSSKDWMSYGNWQCALNQGLDILPDTEKSTISALINGITDKKEIVKILYQYMQDHCRYINVSIGIGGYKPYPASYVAINKYGDCKALTNYMKAILNYAGIESYYTMVNSDIQPSEISLNFPGPVFNHVILAVPIGNDTIWLENTTNTKPAGYLGTSTQNRLALLVSKDKSCLVRTPSLKKEAVKVSTRMVFEMRLNGHAKVEVVKVFRGLEYEEFNTLQSYYNDVEKDNEIRKYMPFDNYEVINWDLKKPHRDSANITLKATLTLYKWLKPLGSEYYFNLYPARIPNFSIAANRSLPVSLPYPIYNSDSLIYSIPAGYELKTLPDTVLLETKYGIYESVLQYNDGKMYILRHFELFTGKYSLEEYPAFYNFLQSVRDTEKIKIVIRPAQQ
jgi:hypothetical protein